MRDDRPLKEVLLKTNEKDKRGRPERRWTDDLVDWCKKESCTLVETDGGQNKVERACETYCGHQQAVSPRRKSERPA